MAENKNNTLSGAEKAVFAIFMILALIGLASNVIWFESVVCTGGVLVGAIATTIVYLGVFYYAFIGYKEPHGNALKYVMLLFAVGYGIFMVTYALYGTIADMILGFIGVFTAAGMAYMSGRLDRINKNRAIVEILNVLLFIGAILTELSLPVDWDLSTFERVVHVVYSLSPLLCWMALTAAYFTRYKMHREAGMQEKKA